jgi:ATP-dependent Clp protease protease subunit
MDKNFAIDLGADVLLQDLSTLKLPDPTLLDYYTRYANREIWWNTDVDDELVEFSYIILKWNREDKGIPVEDRKPIKVYINSDGGSVTAVMNFINAIQLSKTPVHTIGMGKVYSAGGLMLMSGHKRFIFPSTTALIHDGSDGYIGNVGKMKDYQEFSKKMESHMEDWIIKNTKITKELYKEKCREDWWLFPNEIIEYGLADKIITDLDEIL